MTELKSIQMHRSDIPDHHSYLQTAIEEVRTIKDIMQAVENRKASTIVIESERVEQVGEV